MAIFWAPMRVNASHSLFISIVPNPDFEDVAEMYRIADRTIANEDQLRKTLRAVGKSLEV